MFESFFPHDYSNLTTIGFRNERITTDLAMKNLATKFPHVKTVISVCSSDLNFQAKENSENQSNLPKQWNMIIMFDLAESEISKTMQIKTLLTSFKNISELGFENGNLPTDEDIDYLTGSNIEG